MCTALTVRALEMMAAMAEVRRARNALYRQVKVVHALVDGHPSGIPVALSSCVADMRRVHSLDGMADLQPKRNKNHHQVPTGHAVHGGLLGSGLVMLFSNFVAQHCAQHASLCNVTWQAEQCCLAGKCSRKHQLAFDRRVSMLASH